MADTKPKGTPTLPRHSVSARARVSSATLISALVLASCGDFRGVVDAAALARQDDAYVRIVLALAARDPDSLDFYSGPDTWRREAREAFQPLAQVRAHAAALITDLDRVPSHSPDASARRALLKQQLGAVVARVDLLAGKPATFDEESRMLFGEVPAWHDGEWALDIRATIDRLLPGVGTAAQRFAALERRFLVPANRLPDVLSRAVAECRQRTLAHLELPAGEEVALEYVHEMPWGAFTRYQGRGKSRTQINLDFEFTVDRVLDMACHETYPGHHAINVLLDERVQPLFSPQSLRTEGAASYAPALAFPYERRLALERDVLMPLAGLPSDDAEGYVRVTALVDALRWLQVDIARRYLDGRLEFVRAARALEDETLMSAEAAESTLKFFNEFRTYVVAYTVGHDLVHDRVEAAPDDSARWRAYRRSFRP